jgi:hypothetical protein
MEGLIDSIRIAVSNDATDEARVAGVAACRTILTALEAKPGEPFAPTVPTTTTPVQTAVALLRGMPPDQLLDLAISRLRAALPAGDPVPVPSPQSLRLQLVPVPSIAPRAAP